jgi:hypothetical protein
VGIGVRVSSTGDGGEVLSGKAKRSDRSTQKKDFVIRLNETTVMRVANGTDAESPSVRQSEALTGGRGGDARETKRAHNDGGRKLSRLDQRKRLVGHRLWKSSIENRLE